MRKVTIELKYNNDTESVIVEVSNNITNSTILDILADYKKELYAELEMGTWNATDLEYYQDKLKNDVRFTVLEDTTDRIEFEY